MSDAVELSVELSADDASALGLLADRFGGIHVRGVVARLAEAYRQAVDSEVPSGQWIYIHPKTGRAAPCEVIALDRHIRGVGSRDRRADRAWIRTRGRDIIVEMRSLCRQSELSERRGFEEIELPL